MNVILKGPIRGPHAADPVVNQPSYGPCHVVPDGNPRSGVGWLFAVSEPRRAVGVVRYPLLTVSPSAIAVRLSDQDGRRCEVHLDERLAERAIDRAAVVATIVGVVGVIALAHYSTRA